MAPLVGNEKDGLKLILDLHSNRASLGTVAEDEDAFNIFIGKVSKAIMENKLPKLFLKPYLAVKLFLLVPRIDFDINFVNPILGAIHI